jgi:ATP-dependent exoDNAse (exonuclease V) beta subunit
MLKGWVPLTLLSNVSSVIDKIQAEKNKILISTFSNRILEQLSINPNHNIIFEKLGNKYHNFFIDEFQDTSKSQWAILRALIQDCLQNIGEKNNTGTLTLVGDSKQSIYRWRGAKPEQFVEIQNSKDLFFLKPKVRYLKTNHRSQKGVIDFNNFFYPKLIDHLEHIQTKKVYIKKNLKQNIKKKTGGYTQVEFLKCNKNEDIVTVHLNKIIEKIKISMKSGYDYRDIAVLVRKNDEARDISVKFQEEAIPHFVSDALLLKDSTQVKFLINLIELFLNPDVLSLKIQHLKLLYRFLNKVEEIHDFFSSNLNKPVNQVLKENRINFNLDDFNNYSFFTSMEKACFDFPWIDLNDAFVISFLNKILELENSEQISNPHDFLKFWKINQAKWSVPLNDEMNGVKITTVHKAKGLEFPVVIMPFSDRLIYNQKGEKVWFDTSEFLTNDLGYARINLTKKISKLGDYWNGIYEKIMSDQETDSWNFFYVATTRAVSQLFIITSNKNENSYSYSRVLKNILKSKKSSKNGIFEWGGIKNKKRIKITKVKIATEELIYDIKKNDFKEKLFYPNKKNKKESRKRGDLIHEMLSHIYYMEDIRRVVSKYFLRQKIDKNEKEYFIEIFKKINLHPVLKKYFSKSYVSMNEKDILLPNKNILRPDRISYDDKTCAIIDYKTGSKKEKDNLQVIEYMKNMREILKKETFGFIVYIRENKLSVEQIDFQTN